MAPSHKSIVGWELESERRPHGGQPHRVEGARCGLPALIVWGLSRLAARSQGVGRWRAKVV